MFRHAFTLAVSSALALTVATPVRAADFKQVQQNIANHMNAILSDTVNEGDGSAYVQETGGEPAVACNVRPSKSNASKVNYFCTVSFDVKISSESELETRSCFLIYTLANDDLKTLSAKSDLETSCIEDLATGD